MRKKARGIGAAFMATLLSAGLLATPVAASADPVDLVVDMANATTSIAADSAQALLDQATLHSDNISCTVGAYAAAQSPRVVVSGVVTVHAQDVATADGICSDLDAIAPQNYTGFVRIALQQMTAPNTWERYGDPALCTIPSFQGTAVVPVCTKQHRFTDPTDPIQDRLRRARFSAGVVRPDGSLDTRSVRFFGPLSPRICPHLSVSCSL